ncbi:MerR family transcriptional regulator [Marinactinospora thermotolerans]|uniref:Transcriptional regulator, MerR family n=1 Tax=Marinactinospora thermotolerans DSM 45154 TaxID=1122192 RepID=A0A1T4RU32_9ACTN|nr:MerR family transcriptional regulator [Marinactinospora thermotolerans]SKA19407.1 transcriptional regulator, MerR family [Marinactinospora thermotolerans DSM 45154]
MAEYRIDELARLAETTVRNVRVYQDRGLLPPPRREGRVGIYTEAHLARLRLIGQLLKRGYTFANISELVTVWERGGDLADVLGFESAVGDPWTDEIPVYVTLDELRGMFGGQVTPATLTRALRLGLLERDGVRFRAPSPRLLHAGAELVSIGMSLDGVLDIAEQLRERIDAAARDLVGTVADHVLAVHAPGGLLQGDDIAGAAELIRRARPLAQTAVDAILAQAMAHHLQEALGEHFAAVLEHLKAAKEERHSA